MLPKLPHYAEPPHQTSVLKPKLHQGEWEPGLCGQFIAWVSGSFPMTLLSKPTGDRYPRFG